MYWKELTPKLNIIIRHIYFSITYKHFIYTFAASHSTIDCIIRFNTINHTWQLIYIHDSCPVSSTARCGIVYNDYVYVFDGVLYRFHLLRNFWEKVKTFGTNKPPNIMSGISMVLFNKCLWTFGGICWHHEVWNKTYQLSLESMTWNCVETMIAPKGRAHHSAVVYNGCMFVFGGVSFGIQNSFWKFDFSSKIWSELRLKGDIIVNPTFGHSAIELNGKMYIFGGDSGRKCENSLYEINLDTNYCKAIKVGGHSPKVRRFHNSVIVNESLYIMFGEDSNRHCVKSCSMITIGNTNWRNGLFKALKGKNLSDIDFIK